MFEQAGTGDDGNRKRWEAGATIITLPDVFPL
jgi:hypothetical protein